MAVLRHAEGVTGNVSLTCRYYGISRNCFYKWQRRYEEEGIEGLRDRSSAPHHSPNATDADIVNKIVYLRHNHHFGPTKIRKARPRDTRGQVPARRALLRTTPDLSHCAPSDGARARAPSSTELPLRRPRRHAAADQAVRPPQGLRRVPGSRWQDLVHH
ncbi:helix-turn-helix domain-containing protein [Streptomyces goshikiensis]|uniref:helix-turn-helix domain-containing protein n=1 Tax=Streptomyces goshikiensis TaxID=1942 RepID=UPI00364E574C